MTAQETYPWQLGAMTLPYIRWPFERALEGIARAGFRHVGIRHETSLPEAPTAADYRALRQQIEHYGLTPQLMFARSRTPDPAQSLRQDVDTIAGLEVPVLLLIAPSPAPKFASQRQGEMAWFTQVERWFDQIVPAVRRAERHGVTLVLKPHGGIAGTGEDLAALVERIGSPAVRVCYDPGNVVYYEGVRPEGDLPAVADLVRAVCIKDHRGEQAVVDFPTPGDGDIDHHAIFRTLHAVGFTGPCLIERIDGLETPEDADRELARGREYLERVSAEVLHEAV
jgi:sugar phosphate isomerase/epimerase